MAWSWEWVVLIASHGGETLLGTGTLVGPGRILTARHVIFDAKGNPKPDLVVRREGSAHFRPASLAWPGSEALDVAVLTAEVDGAAPSHPLALLSERDVRPGETWNAQGYPKVRHDTPTEKRESEKLEQVGGTTRASVRSELSLDAPTHPEAWGGLSGAAVVIGEQIVGVVRSEPHGWGEQRVSATLVAAFLREPGFRQALGLGADDARLADDLAKLEAKIAAQLQALPRVVDALAEKLALGDDPRDARRVARALVHERTGEAIVVAFLQVDEDLKDDAARVEDRRAVKNLTWQVLPFATDWRALLLRGRAALANGSAFVELPCSKPDDGGGHPRGHRLRRSCRYVDEGARARMPAGNAVVRLPAIAEAPFFDHDGKRLVEATVGHLAVMLLGLAPDDARLRRNDTELRREVDEALQYASEAVGDDRLPRYFLMDDETLREVGSAPAEQARGSAWSWPSPRSATRSRTCASSASARGSTAKCASRSTSATCGGRTSEGSPCPTPTSTSPTAR